MPSLSYSDGRYALLGSEELVESVCYASTQLERQVKPTLNQTVSSIDTQPTTWNVAYDSAKAAITLHNEEANKWLWEEAEITSANVPCRQLRVAPWTTLQHYTVILVIFWIHP